METIQSRLIFARKKARLSQTKLANLVGISQPTYSDLERGDSKSSVWLVAIAKVLGVNPAWLATGELPMEQGAEISATAQQRQQSGADISTNASTVVDLEFYAR